MELYKYDANELVYKKIGLRPLFLFVCLIVFIFSSSGFVGGKIIKQEFEEVPIVIDVQEESFSEEALIDMLNNLKLKHIDIVLAQAKLETNSFKSRLFLEENNLFGMKVAGQRPTTAMHGGGGGHAKYSNWKESVYDYALWQASFARKLNRTQYLQLLSNIYAEDENYIEKLHKFIK